jgi:ABC-type transport system substrate-binding protein
MKGWGLPYEDWPQDLKDEYAYNPNKSKELLAEAGYPNGLKTNIVADATGDIDLSFLTKYPNRESLSQKYQ